MRFDPSGGEMEPLANSNGRLEECDSNFNCATAGATCVTKTHPDTGEQVNTCCVAKGLNVGK